MLTLEVNDNGKGFDANRVKCGNGLRNMTQRANELHGELNRASKEGKGTQIRLEILIA
jgi:signal transduction histidine kinase